MDILKSFADSLNSNKNLSNLEKESIVDFIADLNAINEKTGGINYTNLLNNLKSLKIENGKDKGNVGYSTKENTIYLDKVDNSWRVNLYKALLQCSITNRMGNKIKYGVVDSNGGNYALNEVITQRFLDLMLENSENNILDFEMNIYAKIQEVIGLEKVFESYFNADYETLEFDFANYKVNLKDLAQKYDRLMSINLNSPNISFKDKRLLSDIERTLMNAYAQKMMIEDVDKESIIRFQGNIITPNTVYAYEKDDEDFYEGLKSNTAYFNMMLNGIEMAKRSSKTI